MAIDTAAKQMSMLNFGDGSNIHVLPIPDGAYDSADWQHLLGLYSGIAFAAPHIHRAETIMDAIVTAVTGLTTTGSNVSRARTYPVGASLPAVVVFQANDQALTQLIAGDVTSLLSVSIDALAREPSTQIDTKLNLIREELNVALMADYTLGLAYVEGIEEQGADEPDMSDNGDASITQMRMNYEVTYHHSRTNPVT